MNDAKKAVQRMFSLGKPPRADEVVGNLQRVAPAEPESPSEPMVQVNVRLPARLKKRVRLMAARDGISISELMHRAIALYEEKTGAAPDL